MSYHRTIASMQGLRGFADLPDKTPRDADNVDATVGIPGFNLNIPIVSKERLYLAIGFSVLVGVAGGTVLARYLKKAQE